MIPRPASTADFIAMFFTVVVGVVLIITPIAVVILELTTDADTGAIIETEREVLQVLVGALIGFIAGRGEARREHDNPG